MRERGEDDRETIAEANDNIRQPAERPVRSATARQAAQAVAACTLENHEPSYGHGNPRAQELVRGLCGAAHAGARHGHTPILQRQL